VTLLVIFGAGATHDASRYAAGEAPPPVARRLFDTRHEFGDIIDLYPQVRALVPRLREAATVNAVSIEEVFEHIVTAARGRSATRLQLAGARYYIRDAIELSVDRFAFRGAHGVTNYHELVDRIDAALEPSRDGVLYVTFNYDQLLEVAIADTLGQEFQSIDDYVANTQRLVIKPHGSVNWRRRVGYPSGASLAAPWTGNDRHKNVHWLLGQFETIQVTNEFEVGPPHQFTVMRPVYFPAIAIPTENKTSTSFEFPSAHMYYLEHWLPTVTQVLVIGWRGRENHFWALWNRLRPTPSDMNVVVVDENAEAATEVADHLVSSGLAVAAQGLPVDGFSGYMAQPGLTGLAF
jgi:hypothetical protein